MKRLTWGMAGVLVLFATPFFGVSGHAQIAVVAEDSPTEVQGLPAAYLMRPRWSPDPSARDIAFTSANYRGLWTKDLDTGALMELSDEAGAGFGFEWSPDGSTLAARVSRYEGPRRFDAVKIFDPEVGTAYQLTDFNGRIRTVPTWAGGGESVLLGGTPSARLAHPARAEKAASQPTPAVVTNGNVVLLEAGEPGGGRVLARLESTVLNLVTSADRSMMAFEVLGGDLYIARTDGASTISLGPGSRPSFSPDGRLVVFARTLDDGHRFTASDLYVGSISGEVRRLTDTPDVLEMNPSWSPRGDEIAYDDDGRIYVLRVKDED